ncbi:acetylornithine deacetylase [Lentzea xinjiangensis]|uniref:Acetylornithine deacetylase n=1 Tax=Lentzea xinjiangensis TaxID=402600 RepID=A0A1H9W950_9PSEU|nr:M20/M25/M40 family metallo-hydrolase [Lentzea xinjiangensis]SES30442.1 acetylornithine deacetylase [Lentzea xinjiangensis]
MPRPTDADVRARLDALAEDMLSFLAATVSGPSESGWEDRVTSRYAEWFTAHGWPVTRQPLEEASGEPRAGQRENLIAWYPGRRGLPSVVLNGHVDVVPAGEEQAWSRPPCSGDRDGGLVHGRGSVDVKGGIAAGLYALAALGPGDVTRADAPDECVAEADVVQAAKVLALTLTRLVVCDG